MSTLQVIRTEVVAAGGSMPVGRSPVRMLLGGIELPGLGLSKKYLAPLDMVLLQQVGGDFTEVPEALRSRILGATVTTPGGGLVGTVESFQHPLQPVVQPFAVITPQLWPPPNTVSLWQAALPIADIHAGLQVLLLLPEAKIAGEITAPPHQLPYWNPYHSAFSAPGKFPTTINASAQGAPVVLKSDQKVLLGMLIGTQSEDGETRANIFPISAAQPGGSI